MPALHDMSVLTAKTADLIGRRVLLAEDVSINAEIITMLLSMREMEVDLAENGQIAVDLFAAHEPGYYAAILMDIRMPVSSITWSIACFSFFINCQPDCRVKTISPMWRLQKLFCKVG